MNGTSAAPSVLSALACHPGGVTRRGSVQSRKGFREFAKAREGSHQPGSEGTRVHTCHIVSKRLAPRMEAVRQFMAACTFVFAFGVPACSDVLCPVLVCSLIAVAHTLLQGEGRSVVACRVQ